MRKRGQPFFFLPMFGFADETAIAQPATQADDAGLMEAIRDQLCCGASSCAKAALAAILPILHRERAAAHAAGANSETAREKWEQEGFKNGFAAGRAAERAEVISYLETPEVKDAIERGQHKEQG